MKVATITAESSPEHGSARRRAPCALIVAATGLFAFSAPALAADEETIAAASYPDMSTFTCRTDAIPIHPGQNLNLFAGTKTCPNAEKLSGPADASVFAPGSNAQGYITRFKPSMVEIQGSGELTTPSVWDLHLHHVVWIKGNSGPTFASGEEKTIPKLPQGYGFKAGGDEGWGLNYMIHNLTAEGGRQIYITWEIDWVPETNPARTDIQPASIHWLDVAGAPQIYPVFDAERGFDADGDGDFVFPDDVPTDPNAPGFEERAKISSVGSWTVPGGGRTLVFGAGHLHPGGTSVDLEVARDGADAGTADGDDPAEIRPLFRSDAHYYEPAGAVSWDVSMEATRPEWRIKLKAGDTISIDATYDVEKASWYESMGILPLAVSTADDPAAKDPFDDDAEVRAMYDAGGILTHGRLAENIDAKANEDLKLADPRKLQTKGKVPKSGLDIDGFGYSLGGYSAFRGFPSSLMRPPLARRGKGVTFTNTEALPGMPDEQQAWHSITSCKAPCNRGSGIGYPLADGPIKFDSGQLGFGTGASTEVTTGSNVYTTPPLTKPDKTYTYFCRIHPFMRGSVRTKDKPKNRN
ncbi:MAG: cupredoxin domain-containing protein [Solirubrobacterales bacterium]